MWAHHQWALKQQTPRDLCHLTCNGSAPEQTKPLQLFVCPDLLGMPQPHKLTPTSTIHLWVATKRMSAAYILLIFSTACRSNSSKRARKPSPHALSAHYRRLNIMLCFVATGYLRREQYCFAIPCDYCCWCGTPTNFAQEKQWNLRIYEWYGWEVLYCSRSVICLQAAFITYIWWR